MPFAIEYTERAKADLRALPRAAAAEILGAIKTHLSNQPALESKSRIKRLRGEGSPEYRLRVGGFRAYYDVDGGTVTVSVIAILSKTQSLDYLKDRE